MGGRQERRGDSRGKRRGEWRKVGEWRERRPNNVITRMLSDLYGFSFLCQQLYRHIFHHISKDTQGTQYTVYVSEWDRRVREEKSDRKCEGVRGVSAKNYTITEQWNRKGRVKIWHCERGDSEKNRRKNQRYYMISLIGSSTANALSWKFTMRR